VNTMFPFYVDGKDWSEKWPTVGEVKLKDSHTQDEHTTKTLVYVGSKTCRRSSESKDKRRTSENQGWGKGGKPWIAKWQR